MLFNLNEVRTLGFIRSYHFHRVKITPMILTLVQGHSYVDQLKLVVEFLASSYPIKFKLCMVEKQVD